MFPVIPKRLSVADELTEAQRILILAIETSASQGILSKS
jgi:hypothetical protein